MILKGDFRRKLYEENGESKNIRAVNRSETGVFEIKLVLFGPSKNYDFWWVDRAVISLSYAF